MIKYLIYNYILIIIKEKFYRRKAMKVRLPKHREFLIKFEDKYEKADEAWEALNQIVKDYSVDGKSIYSETFIEDNEDKVKALQEKYEFTYEIIEK